MAAYIDSERLEKDTTWTSQLVGSVLFLSVFPYPIAELSANTRFHMCLMIRGVSVLDVEGSDLSTAFFFLGPCKFDTVFVNLGLFCNKCNHLAWANSSLPVLRQCNHCCKDFFCGTEGNMLA